MDVVVGIDIDINRYEYIHIHIHTHFHTFIRTYIQGESKQLHLYEARFLALFEEAIKKRGSCVGQMVGATFELLYITLMNPKPYKTCSHAPPPHARTLSLSRCLSPSLPLSPPPSTSLSCKRFLHAFRSLPDINDRA